MLRRWLRRRGDERDDERDDGIVCIQFVELVTDYLEGAMTSTDRVRFESHLAACPHCTRYLAQIRATVELSGRLSAADVDALGRDARAELLAVFRAYNA